MTDFVLFKNSADVNSNQLIANRTGHGPAYKEAVRTFDELNILNHTYVILRQHHAKKREPKTITNFFGEIEELGENPWIFGYK